MNKKERFCDVDNIVEWRHIITALFALVVFDGNLLNAFTRQLDVTVPYKAHAPHNTRSVGQEKTRWYQATH